MAMTVCRECGAKISTDARACPHCGASAPRSWRWLLWLIAAFVAFVVYASWSGSTPEAREEFAARDSIDRCWEQQSRKSLTPEAARVLAGACETMERDYKRKYGRKP